MSYYAADQRGYLDDIASVSGMGAFRTWAMHQGGVIHDLVGKGVCHEPQKLADALAAVHSDDAAVDDIREGLMACAARADGIVIISDGVGSDDEDETSSANEEKLFEDPATTPDGDVKAFSALAKEAYAHQEPELRNALLSAWKGAAHGFSMTECRAGVREKDYAKLAKMLVRANTRVRAVVEPRVSASYLRGVQLGARPLARNGVVLRAPDKIRISMSTMNPLAAAWARARAGELVADDARAKDLIKDFVLMAVEDGFDVDETASLIRTIIGLDYRRSLSVERYAASLLEDGVLSAAAERSIASYVAESLLSRATTIARTEIIMAQSAGQQGLWEEATKQGMLSGLRRIWIVAEDCCDECDDIASHSIDHPVGIDEEFDDGVKFPPLHPNCRCTMGLVKASAPSEDDEE